MEEVSKVIADVLSVVDKAIDGIVKVLDITIHSLGELMIALVDLFAMAIGSFAYELLDILDYYGFESWYSLETILDDLDSSLIDIASSIGTYIRTLLTSFDALVEALRSDVKVELASIGEVISTQYQARMFMIYGQIATLSVAINAPPSYLEEAIQNAKTFVLGLSGFVGLSYEQFELDWFAGLNNLLRKIRNSISLYRQNPRQIRVDLETELISPAYEIYMNAAVSREARDAELTNHIEQVREDITNCYYKIAENERARAQLWELTIRPRLEALQEEFDLWIKQVYNVRVKQVTGNIVALSLAISGVSTRLKAVNDKLLYPGDLLQTIDMLPEAERALQENKVAEVTSRQFRRNAVLWDRLVSLMKES